MKNILKEKLKTNKGITLIALVITIIVLLILAGVGISMLTGDNGLIEKANIAKEKTDKSVYEEKLSIKQALEEIEYNEPLKDDDEDIQLKIFITEWNIPQGYKFQLPLVENEKYEYDFNVDWGDGSEISTVLSANDVNAIHTYLQSGNYEIKISGICNGWRTENIDEKKLIRIKQFGDIQIKELSFAYASNLEGIIPEPTKNSFKQLEIFYGAFRQCPKLTGKIPSNLLRGVDKVKEFTYLFEDDIGLTGEIPANLFRDCVNAETFECAFVSCSNLGGCIPKNLFKYNKEAKKFGAVFRCCSSLTGPIPEELFKNTRIITYWSIFYECSNLTGQIPADFFDAADENCIGYWGCFKGCNKITGNAPNIWSKVSDSSKGSKCFFECDNLSNYNEIPDSWK